MDNNNYSPKLREAMEEIKNVLEKYDIAGQVSLHTAEAKGDKIEGFTEFLNAFSPSYSCAKIEQTYNNSTPFVIRIRAKASDFGGDKRKREEAIAATANMFIHLRDQAGRNFMTIDELMNQMEEVTGKFDDR